LRLSDAVQPFQAPICPWPSTVRSFGWTDRCPEPARALRGGGTEVTVHMLAGADHDTVYAPGVAGLPLLR